jgi:hypothetical protein
MEWDDKAYEKLISLLGAVGDVDSLTDEEEEAARDAFRTSFRPMFDGATRIVSEARAQHHYAEQRPRAIVILSQHERRFTPHRSISPRQFALFCTLRDGEPPPDLSEVKDLEPCVVADDNAWAMIHTHEDLGEGGPYFARAVDVHPGEVRRGR